ncbi:MULTISPECIES: flagellar biosynthetic protein FliR [Sphingomonas]|jgi:flagellar biosynthetic protein FliR|uniref:Flagellar biosynthetic protein FliR n=1 Tax=Sphingomonas adhaesiva TaxID=28212 RepID=A0A2A4I5Q0_9SPHN|nr:MULTISPECIES: flagellar biosynthetic protein FliR [Sphingomonas]PCG13815.1 flagellar biosynthetic protein FliR [Sphingomonas adhaesiva]PZU78664.1 MAG: flagellar biosynthetic protein FliR [Sphingomonas sp.]
MLGFGLAIEPQLWALLFVMVRVGAAFVAAPVFGNVSVPVQVRVALSGAVAILVLGTNTIAVPPTVFALSTFLSVAAEALVGLALGFVVQIAFAAPLVAGEIIGGSMGIGFASMMDPTTGRSSPAVSQFLSILLTLLFLSLDGHLVLVDMVAKSYRALPPGAAWMTAGQMRDIAMFGGYAFLAGLLLALPVGFLLLCQNIVMGMLSRSAPALNLFSVGLPASLAVGVVTLGIALPAMGDYMQVIVREGLAAAQSLVLLTTGGF